MTVLATQPLAIRLDWGSAKLTGIHISNWRSFGGDGKSGRVSNYTREFSPVKIKPRVEKIRTKGFSADFIPLVPQ